MNRRRVLAPLCWSAAVAGLIAVSFYPGSAGSQGAVVTRQVGVQLAAGDVAPRVFMIQPNGDRSDSNDLSGRPYLVDFWHPACGPCRGQAPHLNAAYRLLRRARGTVLAIASQVSDDELRQTKRRWRLRYPVGRPFQPGVFDRSSGYGVTRLPASFVVGRDGRIVEAFYRMPNRPRLLAAVRRAI